jgi:hypothetical protein
MTTNHLADNYTYASKVSFQDKQSGTSLQTYDEAYNLSGPDSGTSAYTVSDAAILLWPTSSWPNVSGTCNEVRTQNTTAPYSATNTSTNSYGGSAPISDEQCAFKLSWNSDKFAFGLFNYVNGRQKDAGTVSRTIHTTMKLQTGGNAASRLKNIFQLSASASQVHYVLQPDTSGLLISQYQGWTVASNTIIPPQNIAIGSYGNLSTNGVLYKTLSDNADVDITPYVAGVDDYTFNLGQPQKYYSYFDVFVQQANPGYSLLPHSDDENVGHAFWQFRTDAPTNALQYLSTNLTKYLNTPWGFYPKDGLFTVPGQLQNDRNHPANIVRTFYIGFPYLLQGLSFTAGVATAPPIYSLTGYNCVSAAREAGFNSDVFGLPSDTSPQNFGVTLITMYAAPGLVTGPFYDTNDVFYSLAPY